MRVSEIVAERVRRRGPLSLEEVLDLALYHPDHGFYGGGGGRAGRGGDFITSPEVGPLFGAVLARALDTWWDELGRPHPFVVVEAGAGIGTLARSVLLAEPACAPVLTYVLVERSATLRSEHHHRLPLVPAHLGLGDRDDRPDGPLVVSLAELPRRSVGPSPYGSWRVPVGSQAQPASPRLSARPLPLDGGVVLANELLDNLPFGLLERTGGSWSEVRVGLTGDALPLVEQLVAAGPELEAVADRLAPGASDGARVPVQDAAAGWVGEALALLSRGRLVIIDYADSTSSLAHRPWTDWVRTYRGHERGGSVLADLGAQDVTCEVAVDQLARSQSPASERTQAAFLAAHGLDGLVEEGRRTWRERAGTADLAALRARSRVREAEALADAGGLGGFTVLEWEIFGP